MGKTVIFTHFPDTQVFFNVMQWHPCF